MILHMRGCEIWPDNHTPTFYRSRGGCRRDCVAFNRLKGDTKIAGKGHSVMRSEPPQKGQNSGDGRSMTTSSDGTCPDTFLARICLQILVMRERLFVICARNRGESILESAREKFLDNWTKLEMFWDTSWSFFDTEYDRAKVPPYNGNDSPPAPGSLKELLFPTLLNEV